MPDMASELKLDAGMKKDLEKAKEEMEGELKDFVTQNERKVHRTTQTHRQTDTHTQTETHADIHTDTHTHRHKGTQTQIQ